MRGVRPPYADFHAYGQIRGPLRPRGVRPPYAGNPFGPAARRVGETFDGHARWLLVTAALFAGSG
jgi:hypothetical protein